MEPRYLGLPPWWLGEAASRVGERGGGTGVRRNRPARLYDAVVLIRGGEPNDERAIRH